jgi:hypothetical protein
MNSFTQSRFSNNHPLVTDVGIVALAVAFHFHVWLPFGDIAVS